MRKIKADINISIEKIEKRLSTILNKDDIAFLDQQLSDKLESLEFDLIDALVVAFRTSGRPRQSLENIINRTIANIKVANRYK